MGWGLQGPGLWQTLARPGRGGRGLWRSRHFNAPAATGEKRAPRDAAHPSFQYWVCACAARCRVTCCQNTGAGWDTAGSPWYHLALCSSVHCLPWGALCHHSRTPSMGYCLLDWVTLSPRLQRDEHQLAELRETSFHDSLCLNLGVGVELYQEGDAPSRAHLLPKGSPKSPLQWDGGAGGWEGRR